MGWSGKISLGAGAGNFFGRVAWQNIFGGVAIFFVLGAKMLGSGVPKCFECGMAKCFGGMVAKFFWDWDGKTFWIRW